MLHDPLFLMILFEPSILKKKESAKPYIHTYILNLEHFFPLNFSIVEKWKK